MAHSPQDDSPTPLEARAEAALDWAMTTPGACNTVRFRGSDDPARLGWDQVFAILEEDGLMGVRMLSRDLLPALESQLTARGYRMEFWNVFTGTAADLTQATDRVLAGSPPEGLTPLPEALRTDSAFLKTLRAMMKANGIVPFSTGMLSGRIGGPSVLAALQDRSGRIAACAYAYFPHNRHSPHAQLAWGGLVAVDPAFRGRGLGTWVNAMMLRGALTQMGARAVYELVSEGNTPSRRMVEGCGLALDPDAVSGIATASEGRYLR
ncbi:GNAT family N-acetyltransferase [Oceanicola sp. S124]|uniref:GNAT family N-acetyltransferase n=1 Tax=Oceanicola sp. S124 TaxID=1042378 RepID=UPI000255A715|nr:GNAT family N-acetyltransferase [Oceanicola sp. S124]